MQAVRIGQRNMSKEIGYADWDVVCKACEREFELIDKTRISMDVAEQCQKTTYKLALKERAKFPEPETETDLSLEQAPIKSPKSINNKI